MTDNATPDTTCPRSGTTVDRWNPTPNLDDDRPWQEGEETECPRCGQTVTVTPVAAQARSAGFQAVARLAAH